MAENFARRDEVLRKARDYDALAARLAEAEQWAAWVRQFYPDIADDADERASARAADNGSVGRSGDEAALRRTIQRASTRTASSASACDHRGHPDWMPVPKPAVAAATRFCTDCGQYLKPPETAAEGLTVNSACPHCNGTIVFGTIYCPYCGYTWTNVRK